MPRIYQKPVSETLSIRATPEQMEWLRGEADAHHGSNIAHLIRTLIDAEMKRQKFAPSLRNTPGNGTE